MSERKKYLRRELQKVEQDMFVLDLHDLSVADTKRYNELKERRERIISELNGK